MCVYNDTKLYSQVKVVNFITYILLQLKKKPLMQQILKRLNFGNSLVVQWLGLSAFTAGGLGSIPGQGI